MRLVWGGDRYRGLRSVELLGAGSGDAGFTLQIVRGWDSVCWLDQLLLQGRAEAPEWLSA